MLRQLAVPFALLLTIPAAPALEYFVGASPVWVLLAGAVAVLAGWIRRATEQVATHIGPAIGGLLNISSSNLAELILAFFVLAKGKVNVVRA